MRDVPSPAAIDPFARHLAQLLTVADLAGRLQPPGDEASTARDVVVLARAATGAERASFFQVDNAEADADEPLWAMRLARDTGADDGVEPVAAFHPNHVSLLLAVMQTGAAEALGPFSGSEPFYERHRSQEPAAALHAAFAPVVVDGQAVGVIEVARSRDEAFSGVELARLEAACRTAAAAVYGTRRERSMQALFTALLPELLASGGAGTSLPVRLREWLASRRMAPVERQAISVATTIAELSSSPAALELVQAVLSAARKAFVGGRPASWSEVSGAIR